MAMYWRDCATYFKQGHLLMESLRSQKTGIFGADLTHLGGTEQAERGDVCDVSGVMCVCVRAVSARCDAQCML
jgi:hypothetical protein